MAKRKKASKRKGRRTKSHKKKVSSRRKPPARKKAKSRKTARKVSGAAKRVARATRKVAKVAKSLGQRARKSPSVSAVKIVVVTRGLGEAPERYHFVLSDGRHLRSLYELVDELETMSDDVFKHHVNEFRNDFSKWMCDVFDEQHLADEISIMQNRMDAQRAILKHLVRELRKQKKRRN